MLDDVAALRLRTQELNAESKLSFAEIWRRRLSLLNSLESTFSRKDEVPTRSVENILPLSMAASDGKL